MVTRQEQASNRLEERAGAVTGAAGPSSPVPLVCPGCHRELVAVDRRLRCGQCGEEWSQRGNIACFCDAERYWGEVPEALMKEVLLMAERLNWRKALRQTLGESHPDIYWYSASETRADFRFLLPVDPQSVILDAGAGWGTLTLPLARVAQWVVSLDWVLDRVRFVELRAFQEGVRNIQLVTADIHRLPFPAGTFDVIVANGLLEWVALGLPELDPREAQLSFLRSMRGLLRPGGTVYVGIENRFGIGQWRGDLDHSGLRYTSLLPRRLADRYARWRHRDSHRSYRAYGMRPGYRTYTYSLSGYRRLLREAGFAEVTAYASVPGYNDPRQLVPLEDDEALRFYLEQVVLPRSMFVRLCRWAGRGFWWPLEIRMRRFLSPSILLLARRDGSSEGGGW